MARSTNGFPSGAGPTGAALMTISRRTPVSRIASVIERVSGATTAALPTARAERRDHHVLARQRIDQQDPTRR